MAYNQRNNKRRNYWILCTVMLFIPVQLFLLLYWHNHNSISNQTYKGYGYTEKKYTNTPVNNAIVSKTTPKIALIIDDFGQNRNGVSEILSIDKPLTFAIMPFLDYSLKDAVNAHNNGFEVIVHLPMQSTDNDISSWLGPRPVKVNMTDEEIKNTVLESINSIPFASGANIHMGSMASCDERVMSDVMEIIKENGIYFIDSKTSKDSVCRYLAKKAEIPFTERDIFLENPSKDKTYIKGQLEHAAQIALNKGKSIAIGHVGSAGGQITAQSIKEMIPVIESMGVSFVFASEII